MTLVKICGITNRADAEAAILAGADTLGLNGVVETPRYLGSEAFAAVSAGLSVALVLVVRRLEDALSYPGRLESPTPTLPFAVDADVPADTPGYDYVQFYEGTESGDLPASRLIRVFRVKDASSLDEVRAYRMPVAAILLDTHHPSLLGGAGKAFDWSIAAEAVATLGLPVMLAGGLTPDNVAQAVAAVRPYAVDVASGVEARPGIKDHAKVRDFIQAVRGADAGR